MPEPSALLELLLRLPALECLQPRFMRQALLGLLLIAPMAAVLGVQVINFRMAFFADAISHSAFAGVAIGLLLAIDPHWTMPLFGLLVGLAIMALQRRSSLSTDTVIGVVFAAVMAFGLAVVSRHAEAARDLQRFLYGDILTLDDAGLRHLAILCAAVLLFQVCGYNRLLYIASTRRGQGAPRPRRPPPICVCGAARPGRDALDLGGGRPARDGASDRSRRRRPQPRADRRRDVLVGFGGEPRLRRRGALDLRPGLGAHRHRPHGGPLRLRPVPRQPPDGRPAQAPPPLTAADQQPERLARTRLRSGSAPARTRPGGRRAEHRRAAARHRALQEADSVDVGVVATAPRTVNSHWSGRRSRMQAPARSSR